eukprot:NODE_1623_length_1100_cov_182.586603.p1 GENE.NODE_1623_length_1100_cov_182.586603~~NODE_1623_length_1100_cov_182.586603.p1  ORF type:complete len:301 (-),score=121.67 NODE_1623_length_1100_cov_182.586603:180-1082(-)
MGVYDERRPGGLPPGELDPALWRCGERVRRLEVRWKSGLAGHALNDVGALTRLLNVIVQDSALPSLPDAIGDLAALRSLEVDGNALQGFPTALSKLAGTLEALSAARNSLASPSGIAPIAALGGLVTLNLSNNRLASVGALDLLTKVHLVSLSLSNNQISELPDACWEGPMMLQRFDVAGNRIEELPPGMGVMKEKKLTELLLDENPLRDGKIRNMLQNSAVVSKDVLTYLRKQKGKKGKPNSKAKAKKHEDSEESEADAAPEPPPPPPPPPPASKAKGKKNKGKAKVEVDSDAEAKEVG